MRRSDVFAVVAVTLCFLVGCPSPSSSTDDARDHGNQEPAEPRPEPADPPPQPAEKAPAQLRPEPAKAPAAAPDGGSPQAAADASMGQPEAAPPADQSADSGVTATAPSGPPTAVELVEREGLHVSRLVLARNVEERTPVEPGTTFSRAGGGRVYAYVEVQNPDRVETEVAVTWSGTTGEERGRVTLAVGAMPRWRTWAFTSVERHVGAMVVHIRDLEGNLLARAPFEITD